VVPLIFRFARAFGGSHLENEEMPIRLAAKNIEHFEFSTNRTTVVNQRLATLGRSATILISIVAWFSISNHCALGTLEHTRSASVHPACHGNPSEPKKSPVNGEGAPCCKLLRATPVQPTQSVAQNHFTGLLPAWFAAILVLCKQLHWRQSFELDTGPPFSESFAESVLQRSILAHAPPFALS
jgi:hypothetical protein